jgi:hypothetical protein
MFIVAGMTDAEALNFLAEKLHSKISVAHALGVKPQRLNNWYERGISAVMRPRVWSMVNDHGGHLSRDWLMQTQEGEAA